MRSLPIAAVLTALLPLSATATRAEFDWMAGHWCGKHGSAQIEEYWTQPAGAAVLGVSRTLRDGRMVGFEYMRIESREGRPHFVAQPGGAPATAFALVDPDAEPPAQAAHFHNPAHDFPQSVRYWRDGDLLRAEISGPDGQGGERRIGFAFQPCAATGGEAR